MAIGIISNLYMHENGIHGKADILLYTRMLRELLEEKGVKHVIVNGNGCIAKKGKGSDKKWKKK